LLSLAQFNTLSFFVEDEYKGAFEIDITTGLLFVPEGKGTILDYEEVHSFFLVVTVADRCENSFCYSGKLAKYFVGISVIIGRN
jgi:hypothetical protein